MFTAIAHVPLSDPLPLIEALAGHLREQDVTLERQGEALRVRLSMGEALFRPAADGVEVEARAPDRSGMEEMVDFIASHLLEFCVTEHPVIRWTGAAEAGTLYADFREMTVAGVERMGDWRRFMLTGTDLARFADPAAPYGRFHFPPEGMAPRWPKAGPDGLPLPVDPAWRPAVRRHAIRTVEPEAGRIELDILLHGGGGAGAEWARWARKGDRCGLSGPETEPAVPALRAAETVTLAGDAAARPVIQRLLEVLRPDARGVVLLEGEGPPLENAPQGMQLRQVPALLPALRETADSGVLWAGAEAGAAREIRLWLAEHPEVDGSVRDLWRRGVSASNANPARDFPAGAKWRPRGQRV
ncbi:siderophore-interacting protein [Haematobacter genomosp. 1]|nr:siderophore-interacting protein [Haematobacter genomosp. 1]